MRDIIEDAQKKRFKISDEDDKKKGILISDVWMQELMKHPYHSSKFPMINTYRETWHWNIPGEGACEVVQGAQEPHGAQAFQEAFRGRRRGSWRGTKRRRLQQKVEPWRWQVPDGGIASGTASAKRGT